MEQLRTACPHIFLCLNLKIEISVEKTKFKRFYQSLKITLFMDKNDLHWCERHSAEDSGLDIRFWESWKNKEANQYHVQFFL